MGRSAPVIVITPDPGQWDTFVLAHPRGHALQLSAWAALKGPYGWAHERVALTDAAGAIIGGAQILFRRLPLRLGTLAYLPFGPLLTPAADAAALWAAVHRAARRHRAVLLKWEPGFPAPGQPDPDFAALGFRPARPIQPPRTILIDIRADDETILARMNQGTRRKIRQSQKHGVRVFAAARADVERFTRMMTVTGERNAFGVHEPGYYALAYDQFVPDRAALLLAEHEGDDLAGVMVFAVGANAWYLYGASSNVKRNLMGAYAVQWAAIQWAKARGCTTYDLWGIPDEDEAALEAQFEHRSDGLWGVYGFKRGWGGAIARTYGAWDYVYQPVIYAAYQIALNRRAGAG
jgi:lipid II:glycine glycyltransferase (peptidoglycan interpeptide bridge formation enzyme)